MRVDIEGPELARVLCNALAFMPARSMVRFALLDIYPGHVDASGTDGYAAGTDWAPCRSVGVPRDGVPLLLDKEGLTALERAARESKKGSVSLDIAQGSLTLTGAEAEAAVTVPWFEDEKTLGLHGGVSEMIAKRDRTFTPFVGPVCFDPSFMSRFAKVKADKTSRQADLFFTSPRSALLVKIGPTFKGLVMPIEREAYAKNVGADGLWNVEDAA